MRIVLVCLFKDTMAEEPMAFLERTVIYRELGRALAARGHEVDVVITFHSSARFEEDGVRYHFLKSVSSCIQRVKTLSSQIIHFFGTTLNLQLWLLLRSVNDRATRVLVHHHGGEPAANPIFLNMQRGSFRRVSRFLFATVDHAKPFIESGMMKPSQVTPFIDTSCTFRPGSRAEAREITGMTGDPVFVSTGRLHSVKDPETTLLGFAEIRRCWPHAKLYMFYRSAPMLDDVQALIRQRPILKDGVILRGEASRDDLEAIYQSADFFVQASRREVSGFALIEAMACGAIPVVTAIPSFRAITANGNAGLLFPTGDHQAMADAVLRLKASEIVVLSKIVRAHFEKQLSFNALAKQAESIYADIGAGNAEA